MKTTTTGAAAGAAVLDELRAALAVRASDAEGWEEARQRGDETAAILASLDAERVIIAGALVQPLLARGLLTRADAVATFGEAVTAFATDLERLGEFQAGAQWSPGRGLSAVQADTLRRMLLAVVTDPRLVLVRLAEQLRRMRHARDLEEAPRLHLAWQTREIYAPLANRLGIWQLKWELEDLSFRYLEPAEYRRIAGWLNESRLDREKYIETVIADITAELARAGISAEVVGRPKHIYSIWRKMHRKNLAFDQVFDVRAVRVITDSLVDCYAALGVVHGRWHYIPGEFDDYIATPKDNLYRSLHTAVLGPSSVPVEIQIRTRDMHDQAELGVAAHWRYKEGAARDAAYDRKIEWLRELLAPASEGESDSDFLSRVRADLFDDRVYALTPKGEVVDLPGGATPIDFAYHVHTELGHRCRGARVNGRIVPLNHRLANGEVVDIIGGKRSQPSRDWLIEREGFLASPRSRAKVRAWFKKRDLGENKREGRELFERELARLGGEHTLTSELIGEFALPNAEALHIALGNGDLSLAQVSGAIERRLRGRSASTPAADLPPIGPSAETGARGGTGRGCRRPDVHPRALLQSRAAGIHHRLRHGGPRHHAAPDGLPQSRAAGGTVAAAPVAGGLGQARIATLPGRDRRSRDGPAGPPARCHDAGRGRADQHRPPVVAGRFGARQRRPVVARHRRRPRGTDAPAFAPLGAPRHHQRAQACVKT